VKKVREKKLFFGRRFKAIFKQKCSYLRPLLSITFPQGFRISKNIGHPTSGSGGKKTVKKDRKTKKTEKSEEKNFFCAAS
jgi:type IV secretory pathway ATPase VirB11/archaellum biosynthesis ATPase